MAYDIRRMVQRLYFLSGDFVKDEYEVGKMGQETSESSSGTSDAYCFCTVFCLVGEWYLAWSSMEICGLWHVLLRADAVWSAFQTDDISLL